MARRVYIVARTGTGRPSLQHVTDAVGGVMTRCGYDTSRWSREYTATKFGVFLCLKCKKIEKIS